MSTKDFHEDLVQLRRRLVERTPFALARFGDGEMSILFDEPIDLTAKGHGEARFNPRDPRDQALREELLAALRFRHPQYWVGLPCPCCVGQEAFERMAKLSEMPELQLTWANLLVNSNYDYFLEQVLPVFRDRQVHLVCNHKANLDTLPFSMESVWKVGTNAWRDNHEMIQKMAAELSRTRGAVVLAAAGHLGNLLCHQLFAANPANTILNIGSTLDPFLFGASGLTRGYLRHGPTRRKTCVWGKLPTKTAANENSPAVWYSSYAQTSGDGCGSSVVGTFNDDLGTLCSSSRGNWRPDTSFNVSGQTQEDDRPGITAILTAYLRPHILARQVEAIRNQTVVPASIWLWANEPDSAMQAAIDSVDVDHVIISRRNARFHARFAWALTARTEFVALFDDDTIPGPKWFDNCLDTIREQPGILGAAGVRLTRDAYQGRTIHGWHDPKSSAVEVDLVGHAWFLRTEWLKYLFSDRAVTGTNGEDIELSARAWRIAGIRSFCPPHPPADLSRWGSVEGQELGSDMMAASRNGDHLAERDRIVEAEIRAGWSPLFRRNANQTPLGEKQVERTMPALTGKGAAPQEMQDAAQVVKPVTAPLSPQIELLLYQVPQSAHRILVLGEENEAIAAVLTEAGKDATSLAIESANSGGVKTKDHLELLRSRLGDLRSERWDCVVLDGTLENTAQPRELLETIKDQLAPDGSVVIAVNNLRHHRRLANLLRGRWVAGNNSGAQRFFTRNELEKLCYRARIALEAIEPVIVPEDQSRMTESAKGQVKLDGLHMEGLDETDVRELFADRWIVQGRRQVLTYEPTSIVLVTHNQVSYTRQCLESIRFLTDEPYELIVVDNGSTDGTVQYLRSCRDVRLIENPDNRGFPAAVNQGIAIATGRQILLLNNDTLVTTGWLRRMLAVLERDPRIGLVGPYSNNVSGYQQIPAGYEQLPSLDGFAWRWGQAHAGRIRDVSKLIGFCLLIRREVIDQIGLLDEQFGIGNFEDDDYCRRALEAGYRAVIAEDSFVHHFGSQTFLASGVDFAELLRTNEQKYRAKWGDSELSVPSPATASVPRMKGRFGYRVSAEGKGLELTRESLKLSLCMIVRDNERTIRPALESIRPWVDEMIVVDTGSTDATPAIAAELGARVFQFAWCDDFSAARNESLRHARGDWIFWMDSDDTIPEDCGERLRTLADGHHEPGTLGYVMQVHCPGAGPEGAHDVTVVDHVKMFRNEPELLFEHRIHEQIIPAIRRAGGDVAWSDIYVVHSGSDHSQDGRQRKIERDLRILAADLAERPEHPFVLFNLGMTYADIGEHEKAIDHLRRCLAVSQPEESQVRKAYALAIGSLTQCGRYDEAWELLERGQAIYPKDPELRFREGILAHHRKQFDAAERAYLSVLEDTDERHFTSVDQGITGYKARHNLALVYTDQGRLEDAAQQWRLIVEEVPTYREGWRGLGETLVRLGDWQEAEAVAEKINATSGLRSEGLLLRARLAKACDDGDQAERYLREALTHEENAEEPLRALGQLLFEQARFAEAADALTRLVEIAPDDAAALHNLGAALAQSNRPMDALSALEGSLNLRPQSSTTKDLHDALMHQFDPTLAQ